MRNQRERLYAAMVAVCAEKGYDNTSVADLLELSGVSRNAFYEHFSDREDCFVGAVKHMLGDVVTMSRHLIAGEGDGEERARAVLEALLALVAMQPAAARLCLLESYVAGERAVQTVWSGLEEINQLGLQALEEVPGSAETVPELASAIIGGFHRVVYERLHQGREAELPELIPHLWEWAMSYPPPPEPLRAKGRRRAGTPLSEAPPFAAYDPEQRLIRAFAAVVAEKGYAQTTIADIANAASISQSTFYSHFDDKADAMAAALDSSGAQMLAAVLPAARRAPDWKQAVRTVAGATCAWLASEPAFARMRILAVYGAGPEAIAQRDAAGVGAMKAILSTQFESAPEVGELIAEALIGAINALLMYQVHSKGPEALLQTAPLITYVALTPFVGAEEACRVANGDGRRR